jgi:hypothetical protein
VESIVKPVPLDAFIPVADARERYALTVRAGTAGVPAGARLRHAVRAARKGIFRLRERLMGSHAGTRVPRGIVEETRALGWGCLLEQPGELFIGGAVCQPWLADVVFRSVPPDRFATFAEPGHVRIAWTLEAHPLGSNLTELVSDWEPESPR